MSLYYMDADVSLNRDQLGQILHIPKRLVKRDIHANHPNAGDWISYQSGSSMLETDAVLLRVYVAQSLLRGAVVG